MQGESVLAAESGYYVPGSSDNIGTFLVDDVTTMPAGWRVGNVCEACGKEYGDIDPVEYNGPVGFVLRKVLKLDGPLAFGGKYHLYSSGHVLCWEMLPLSGYSRFTRRVLHDGLIVNYGMPVVVEDVNTLEHSGRYASTLGIASSRVVTIDGVTRLAYSPTGWKSSPGLGIDGEAGSSSGKVVLVSEVGTKDVSVVSGWLSLVQEDLFSRSLFVSGNFDTDVRAGLESTLVDLFDDVGGRMVAYSGNNVAVDMAVVGLILKFLSDGTVLDSDFRSFYDVYYVDVVTYIKTGNDYDVPVVFVDTGGNSGSMPLVSEYYRKLMTLFPPPGKFITMMASRMDTLENLKILGQRVFYLYILQSFLPCVISPGEVDSRVSRVFSDSWSRGFVKVLGTLYMADGAGLLSDSEFCAVVFGYAGLVNMEIVSSLAVICLPEVYKSTVSDVEMLALVRRVGSKEFHKVSVSDRLYGKLATLGTVLVLVAAAISDIVTWSVVRQVDEVMESLILLPRLVPSCDMEVTLRDKNLFWLACQYLAVPAGLKLSLIDLGCVSQYDDLIWI